MVKEAEDAKIYITRMRMAIAGTQNNVLLSLVIGYLGWLTSIPHA